MFKRLKLLSMLLCMAAALPAVALPAVAQQRAYAPENLRTLSYNDQVRVISLEYQEQSAGRRIPDDQLRFYLDQVNRSNWGFSRIKSDIAQSLSGSGTGPRPPTGNTLRCESRDNRAQTCRTPWQGPSRLVRQLSSQPCVEGRTWQSQQGQVYVGGGCRAEFAAAPAILPPRPDPGWGGGQTVRCESIDNRSRSCRTSWHGPSRLLRQLSGSPCIEGRSWRSEGGQVWVGQGCRGEFTSVRGVGPPDPGTGRTVTCSSVDNRTVTCPWPPGYGTPRLIRQVSGSPCIQGRTWGIQSRTAIWVGQGCRGVFGN